VATAAMQLKQKTKGDPDSKQCTLGHSLSHVSVKPQERQTFCSPDDSVHEIHCTCPLSKLYFGVSTQILLEQQPGLCEGSLIFNNVPHPSELPQTRSYGTIDALGSCHITYHQSISQQRWGLLCFAHPSMAT
jgi:hypothetical protein